MIVVPWRDRRGKFLPLKAAVLAASFVPGAVLTYWWAAGLLSSRPVTDVIHGTGDWAIRTILITLAITPAARVLNWPRLLLVRRMVGLTALAYALAHLTLYALDQNFRLGFVVSEIVHRFYLTIGFVALVGLGVLGATSTNGWIARLGRWWKRIHWAIYAIGAIALVHYFIQSKANVSEPVFFAGLFVWLMLWRAVPMAWQRNVVVHLGLTVVAAVATAWIEFAWYAIATGINPWRVLAASETLRFGLRPAHYVALMGLGVTALAAVRRYGPMVWSWLPKAGGRLKVGNDRPAVTTPP
ncbi:MAG TPA: protein-methionine-sulfoxide reductase heme-binding subunit MsrQ [Acetobacteraceae bacterium]|jgi:sulfoxide reductase heme-binding subunit YedZ|nr:protein-methionine-sulfoxide reductase heme-binding subunit MsrQ [Acetobacteraceae bacterium]